MATSQPSQPYLPVALVARLADGQLAVLYGQAEDVETSLDNRVEYTTTVEWRPGLFTQARLHAHHPGVELRDSAGPAGRLFQPPSPLPTAELAGLRARVAQLEAERDAALERAMLASEGRVMEAEARVAQLETTGGALLAALDRDVEEGTVSGLNRREEDEFRAVLDGNATPTDREHP